MPNFINCITVSLMDEHQFQATSASRYALGNSKYGQDVEEILSRNSASIPSLL